MHNRVKNSTFFEYIFIAIIKEVMNFFVYVIEKNKC